MNEIENTGNYKDIYSVWNDGVNNSYLNMKKSILQFNQVTINMFQEYIKSVNGVASSTLDIQREFVPNAVTKSTTAEPSINIVHNAAEKTRRLSNVQNSMSAASIEAVKKSTKKYQIVEIQDDRLVLMEVGAADTDFEKRKIIDL